MQIPKILSFLPAICHSAEWTYQQSWDNLGECSGKSQSPIDINSRTATQASSESDILQAAEFINQITASYHTVELKDPSKGHSLKYSFKPEIESSALKCPQFHLHINQSEHTINGRFSFAEMHIVCYKNNFGDLMEAIVDGKPGNLAVFGFMIDVGYNPRGDFAVQDMISSHDRYNPRPIKMKLPRPADLRTYYRYQGSLTTPTCNEVVTWTVFQDPIRISPMQKWSMENWGENLKNNNRPVQALNNREVTLYHAPPQFSQNAFFNQGYGTNKVYGQNYYVGNNNWSPMGHRPIETVQKRPFFRPMGNRNQNNFWLWWLLSRG